MGVLVVGGLLVCFRGVPAWWTWQAEARTAAQEAISQAAWSDAVIGNFAASLDSLAARATEIRQLGPAFLAGETRAEAASTLTGLLADLARLSLVRLDAVDTRIDTSRTGALPRVWADVQAVGDIHGLAAFLERLERNATLLAVRRLSVRPQSAESPADQPELLTLRFSVEGLALVRPSSAPEPGR
jgi:hypothetical protein